MVRLTAEFKTFDGVLYDPTTVTVTVTPNTGTPVTAAAVKASVGVYYYDYAPGGEVYIRIEFTGTTGGAASKLTTVLLVDTSYRKLLRITSDAMDEEIIDLFDAALGDLDLSGVINLDVDPNIKRAINLYIKWQFGYDNPDADRLQRAYESRKGHLSLAGEYNAVE